MEQTAPHEFWPTQKYCVAIPYYNLQAKNLTIAKKSHEELKSVNAQVLQQVLKILDKAFTDMKAKDLGLNNFGDLFFLWLNIQIPLRWTFCSY
jgi:hypothetical protein